jgi:Protein-L-isoaspartate(D-aspartate) O-methyltransferase (PCMT)
VAVPPPPPGAGSPEDLIRLLQAEGIGDRRVLAAFRAVPRALFVPAEAVGRAYLDEPIRIPRGQVTTQPSLIAAMVAALGLTGGERVLEVGTGLGFQTAILARLAGQVAGPVLYDLGDYRVDSTSAGPPTTARAPRSEVCDALCRVELRGLEPLTPTCHPHLFTTPSFACSTPHQRCSGGVLEKAPSCHTRLHVESLLRTC